VEQGATEGQAVMNRHSGQHGEADGDDEVSEQRQSFAGLEGRALDRALDQGAVLVTFANDAGHCVTRTWRFRPTPCAGSGRARP
jgi:phosphoglucomutase